MIKLMTLLPRLQDKLSTQSAAHNHEADNRKGYADGHIYTTLVLARLFQSTSINQLQELAADLFPFSSLVFLCFYSLTGMNNGAGGVEQAVAGSLPAVSLRRAQWRLADERCELQEEEMEYVRRFHHHEPGSNQCNSFVAKHVRAPLHTVWSLVRRFDQPQLFKPFVRKCVMRGNIDTGSVREVIVQSGLPATRSMERLEFLDDNEHILRVKFIDGDHMLKNYTSTLTVHSEVIDGQPGTLVIESFVVDIPEGNTKDDICYFVENLLRCNLRTLADVTEKSLAGP